MLGKKTSTRRLKMFRALWSRYRYSRFEKKWFAVKDAYQDMTYFKEIMDLFISITPKELSALYREHDYIPTYYRTYNAWCEAVDDLKGRLIDDRLVDQGTMRMLNIPLYEYVIMEDGREGSFTSMATAISEDLLSLYEIIETYKSKAQQTYVFRQYREVFLSGIAVMQYAVNKYFSR